MNMLDASKALEESLAMLKHWASYVDNHYREKWGFDKDVNQLEAWIQECKASHFLQMNKDAETRHRIERLHEMLDDKWW